MSETATDGRLAPTQTLVSVVLPVYNEERVLRELAGAVIQEIERTGSRYEIVFVNDGSADESPHILDSMAAEDPGIKVVHFSRNFGHQAAVHAGLDHASGDAVVVMDSDLQDLPAAIPRFLEAWRDGADVVYAVRVQRKEAAAKRFLFDSFYRVLNRVSEIDMPMDAGNFGLLDRRVVDQICGLPERARYYPGLRTWVGFRQQGIEVERGERYDDTPRVSLKGLFRLAKTAIFSFSSVPLSIFYTIAGLAFAVAVALAIYAVGAKLMGQALYGWTSQVLIACTFGSLNSLGIAVLGEYVIRIYDEVRRRPVYVVGRAVNFAPGDD